MPRIPAYPDARRGHRCIQNTFYHLCSIDIFPRDIPCTRACHFESGSAFERKGCRSPFLKVPGTCQEGRAGTAAVPALDRSRTKQPQTDPRHRPRTHNSPAWAGVCRQDRWRSCSHQVSPHTCQQDMHGTRAALVHPDSDHGYMSCTHCHPSYLDTALQRSPDTLVHDVAGGTCPVHIYDMWSRPLPNTVLRHRICIACRTRYETGPRDMRHTRWPRLL